MKKLPRLHKREVAISRINKDSSRRAALRRALERALASYTFSDMREDRYGYDHYSALENGLESLNDDEETVSCRIRDLCRLMFLPLGKECFGLGAIYIDNEQSSAVRIAAIDLLVNAFGVEADDRNGMANLLMGNRKWDFWISGHFSSHWRSEHLVNDILGGYGELFEGNILVLGAGTGEEADAIRQRAPSSRVTLLEMEPAYCLSALMCGHTLIDDVPTDLRSGWGGGHEGEFDVVFFLNPDPAIGRDGDQIIEQIDSALSQRGRFIMHIGGRVLQENPFFLRFKELKQYAEAPAIITHINRADPSTVILRKPRRPPYSRVKSLLSPQIDCT